MRFGAARRASWKIKTIRFPFTNQYFWSLFVCIWRKKLKLLKKTKLFGRLIGNIMRIFWNMFGGPWIEKHIVFSMDVLFSDPRWYPKTLCGRSMPQHTCHATNHFLKENKRIWAKLETSWEQFGISSEAKIDPSCASSKSLFLQENKGFWALLEPRF